ncbi:MAG TPA: tetratricopeptide repeat protein, partial [Geobacteraceae bacterium]
VTLLPVIGVVQVGRQAMADRYTYLPSVGAFLLMGVAVAWGARKLNGRGALGAVPAAAGVVILVLLAVATWRQIEVWHDGITLWTPVIDRYRGHEHEALGLAMAFSNRGIALHRRSELDAAIADYTKAIELEPKDDAYYKNRGTAHMEKKEFDPALADFMRAIELNPASGGSYYNVACLHALRGETAEACAWLKKSIDHGYDDRERIASDQDLASIRGAACYGPAVAGK